MTERQNSLLLTPERELPYKRRLYTRHGENGQFGAFLAFEEHTHTVGSKSHREIDESLRIFMENACGELVVMQEGRKRIVTKDDIRRKSLNNFLMEDGEQTYIAAFAEANNIRSICADSEVMEEMPLAAEGLHAQYEDGVDYAQIIALHNVMRCHRQLMEEYENDAKAEDDMNKWLEEHMERQAKLLAVPGSRFKPEHFLMSNIKGFYKEIFGVPLDLASKNLEVFNTYQTSDWHKESKQRQKQLAERSVIIRTAIEVSKWRDVIIGRNIQEEWRKGNSIYAALGGAHILKQVESGVIPSLGRPYYSRLLI